LSSIPLVSIPYPQDHTVSSLACESPLPSPGPHIGRANAQDMAVQTNCPGTILFQATWHRHDKQIIHVHPGHTSTSNTPTRELTWSSSPLHPHQHPSPLLSLVSEQDTSIEPIR
jgi:hypothetical protein